MSKIEKQELSSINIIELQLQKFKEQFPEAFTEANKVDWEKLRLTLGETIDTGKERFGMNWPGKADCFKTIQQPSIATLVPARKESVNFDTTENLFIEGDNLEVLKLLQKSYLGKIKMIYIDPPYNTGNDFIYPDNYTENLQTYLEYTGQVDSEGRKFGTNTDLDGRFHSKWMNMMYPRLFLAKNLLRENGVIFISIGQTEFANLTNICNEVFGEENRVGIVTRVMKSGGNKGKYFSPNTEYILIYAKNTLLANGFKDELSDELVDKVYNQIEKEGEKKGEFYRTMGLYQSSLDARANQRYFIEAPDGTLLIPPGNSLPEIKKEGEKIKPENNSEGVWRWIYERYLEEKQKGNIEFKKSKNGVLIDADGNVAKWNIYTKIWLKERQDGGRIPVDFIDKFENRHSSKELQELEIPFDFAKPSDLIAHLIRIMGLGENEILLDFFSGSGTSAHSLLKQYVNDGIKRRFIMVQLPEIITDDQRIIDSGFKTIADIGKERIRRVIDNINKDLEKITAEEKETLFGVTNKEKLDLGFKVFKLQQSNFKIWDANIAKEPEAIQTALDLHIDHISKEATQEAILFELLLKSGFELATPIEQLSLKGKIVYSIAEGELLICLEKELNHEVIKAMADRQPTRVICLDEGFLNNDQLKTNAVQIMKSKGVLNFRTV
jgi:adenine-specific DNA-methyltransferase